MSPPDALGVQPGPPSELHRLLRAGAEPRPPIPIEVADRFEESFATDPWYIHLYRTGHAYHGVHPFYMWYWCAHALQHLGAVIVVGGDQEAVHRLGFRAASTLADALEMASDVVGPSTVAHPPAHTRRSSWPTCNDRRAPARPTPCSRHGAVRGRSPPALPGDRPGRGSWRRRLTPAVAVDGLRAGRAGSRWPHPSWPESVPRPSPRPELGVDYDTAWSRRYPVRLARAMVLDNVTRPLARAVASPCPRRGAARRPGRAR